MKSMKFMKALASRVIFDHGHSSAPLVFVAIKLPLVLMALYLSTKISHCCGALGVLMEDIEKTLKF